MSDPSPSIALITTVYNESSGLDAFLESIDRQTAQPCAVIVVDGGSTDGTPALLEEWQRRSPHTVVIHSSPGANISRGRNIAAGLVESDYLAVTDAGTVLSDNWLADLQAALDGGADVAAGFFTPAGQGFFERLLADMTVPLLAEVDSDSFLPSSRSVAFRRDVFTQVGGYPEWLPYCEDLVLDLRLKAAGAQFRFVPTATVTWSARSSARQFAKQYFRYARGDGHALLWPRRHALRYLVYAALLITARSGFNRTWRGAVLAGYAIGHQRVFLRRVLYRGGVGQWSAARRLVTATGLVIVGDVAKMAGYPVGRWQRARRRVVDPDA